MPIERDLAEIVAKQRPGAHDVVGVIVGVDHVADRLGAHFGEIRSQGVRRLAAFQGIEQNQRGKAFQDRDVGQAIAYRHMQPVGDLENRAVELLGVFLEVLCGGGHAGFGQFDLGRRYRLVGIGHHV